MNQASSSNTAPQQPWRLAWIRYMRAQRMSVAAAAAAMMMKVREGKCRRRRRRLCNLNRLVFAATLPFRKKGDRRR